MHETFRTLLRDTAHWEFEIFLMLLFDGLVAGILWPFVRVHWKHHLAHDNEEALWEKIITRKPDDEPPTTA